MKVFIIILLTGLTFVPTSLELMCRQCNAKNWVRRGFCSINGDIHAVPEPRECPENNVCYFADYKMEGHHIIYEACSSIPPPLHEVKVNECFIGTLYLGKGKYCLCDKDFCTDGMRSASSSKRLHLTPVACFVSGFVSVLYTMSRRYVDHPSM